MKKVLMIINIFIIIYFNCIAQPSDPPICDNPDCNYTQLPWLDGSCRFKYPINSHCSIEVLLFKKRRMV